ncbi:MAG TPA: ArsA-related P-loop ATPase [Candidatus Binatia bacterium]|nr:ArsA-related P-loop ATPase [Candidatus Binatia bacterium]
MARASRRAGLDDLLRKRVIFVAGKGGTGKTTVTAALALIGARRGLRVLAVEVDAKGDLPAALGHPPVGFRPVLVQRNLSVIALHADESFQEYLGIFFRVPRFTRLTPLAGVFDFVASGVPGPRDMLMVGKIAYEERRREADGRPTWDLIVVDSTASGHVLSQLTAARAMRKLVRGGMIGSQVDFVDAMVTDHRVTALCITALPEEMPVTEALDLHDQVVRRTDIGLGPCFLNRSLTPAASRQRRLLELLGTPAHTRAVAELVGDGVEGVVAGALLAERLAQQAQPHARRLTAGLSVPVIPIPLVATRPGLVTTRAVAGVLEAAA